MRRLSLDRGQVEPALLVERREWGANQLHTRAAGLRYRHLKFPPAGPAALPQRRSNSNVRSIEFSLSFDK
jgi:hypothetical protein